MNKELKIFAVVAAFTLALYYGVEPFAHSQMHKHVEGNGFIYDGKADIAEAKDEKTKAVKEAFWADVAKVADMVGNPKAGEAAFATCTGCHMDGAGNMGGVIPPSLDHAGAIYDKAYLVALIKDPAMASNVDHKYEDTMTHPMGAIKSMVTDNQQIADIVAYMKAEKAGPVTPKEAYVESCGRCHAMRYANWTQVGFVPATKANIKTGQDIDGLKFQQAVAEEQNAVAAYMGKLPPDLSMMVRARSHHFMETFVENPQSQLHGTAMPRVGLSAEGYEKVQQYLSDIGDPSKPARAIAAPWVLGFLVIFTILAYLWKQSLWRDLH
ncbi:MAG: cytochrome c1 [Sulfurovaceae bacterium]|nr:cytochrome c1 [Sulfurovaceae bacterium]